MANGGLAGEERRPHVDRHRLVEALLRLVRVGARRHHAGVVHEHVETAQPAEGLLDHAARRRPGGPRSTTAVSTGRPSGRARTVAASRSPSRSTASRRAPSRWKAVEEAAPDTARGPRDDHGPILEATVDRAVLHHAAWICRQASSHLS